MKKFLALLLALVMVLSLCACTGGSGSSSSSSKTDTCKSCGRSFPAGDDGGNYMNIARTGMCKNCYNNYKDMSEWLGK